MVGGCRGQRQRLALAQIEMELRAEESLSVSKASVGWPGRAGSHSY